MDLSEYDTLKQRLRPGQLLDLLFNQVPDTAFFVKDTDYRFVNANLALVKIIGAPSLKEVVGKTDLAFTSDFLAEAFRKDDQSVIEEGRIILNQIELVPTPTTLEWRSTTKVPLYDHDNHIIGLAGMTRAISDNDAAYREHPEMHVIVDYIQSHYQESLTKTDMAEAANISISTVERLFRKTFGITPGQYARKIRLNVACQKLRDTDEALVDIASACGFFDQASMTHAFRSEIKITPNRFRLRFSKSPSAPPSVA